MRERAILSEGGHSRGAPQADEPLLELFGLAQVANCPPDVASPVRTGAFPEGRGSGTPRHRQSTYGDEIPSLLKEALLQGAEDSRY